VNAARTESIDVGYVCFFIPEHQNWFGIDEILGPVAISIRREKVASNGITLPPTGNTGHAPLGQTVSAQPTTAQQVQQSQLQHPPLTQSASVAPSAGANNGQGSVVTPGLDLVSATGGAGDQYIYRLIVRTNELQPMRGCVLEDSIPSLKSEKVKGTPAREVLEFVCPELQLSR